MSVFNNTTHQKPNLYQQKAFNDSLLIQNEEQIEDDLN